MNLEIADVVSKELKAKRSFRSAAIIALAAFLAATGAASIAAPDRADAKSSKKTSTPSVTNRKPIGPLTAVISLNSQRMTVYDSKGAIATTRVSTGKRGNRTPTGVFSIIQKRRQHYSNLYANASMPYMQRITWSGFAIHAGVVPGYPASHGCIRLPYGFAKRFWSMTGMGDRVIITRNGAIPNTFAHAALLRPLPPGNPVAPLSTETDAPPKAAPSSDVTDVTELIGVRPALASIHKSSKRTRALVDAERFAEVDMRRDKLVDASDNHASASNILKAANQAVKNAQIAISLSQRTAKGHRKQVADAKAAKRRALGKMKAFFESYRGADTEEAVARGVAREDALEAELISIEESARRQEDAARTIEAAIDRQMAERDALIAKRNAVKKAWVAAGKVRSDARAALDRAKVLLKQKDRPVHIMVSRKSQMLYVRQGHQDILEAPVSIRYSDDPIGTHVFTATTYTEDETDLEWQVTTAAFSAQKASKTKAASDGDGSANAPKQTATNALDRLEISQELRERLAEMIKPGSSLIISDEQKSQETGLGTDIIVLTRS